MNQALIFHRYYFLVIVKNKGQLLGLFSYPIKNSSLLIIRKNHIN